ncbi:MAG TPA: GAF domain-containing sensor histidine kinase, partial [Anaerolineae bacterium]|nr:GAF domain-containing sensor histidine kinase [Anaerolineae bacterium]
PYTNLSLKSLLIATLILSLTTAAYSKWDPPSRNWLIGTTTLIAVATLFDIFYPLPLIPLPSLFSFSLTIGAFLSLGLWFAIHGYVTQRMWRDYSSNRFPLHANRILLWLTALTLIIAGETILLITPEWTVWIGHSLRLTGVFGLAYAISSYRMFDVRTRARRIATMGLYTALAALPAISLLLLLEQLTGAIGRLYTNILLILTFASARPITSLVESFVQRFFPAEDFETSVAVRNYTQAISKTLDMEQLSLVMIGTISEMLEINRGSLVLVSENENKPIVHAIPAMGRIPREKTPFPSDSLFLNHLDAQRQPLSQYELDFDPTFQAIADDEKAWLKAMDMDLYVPISTGSQLLGIIAIGPKSSGLPYAPAELELVQILADQTVIALQNAQLYSTLETQNGRVRLLNADLVEQNKRLEVMDKVKSDFITIASHELRTPLTQVKGYADILSAMNEDNALNRKQTREIAGHINRAATQLEKLIAAMLDASQLDIEGIELNMVNTRLDTIINLAVEPLLQPIRERRIQYHTIGLENLPQLHVDFKRLVQAFGNIIGNAVKYTPNGGHITVKAQLVPSEDKASEYIELTIADTGIGIDPQYHELIFEKFFRVDDPQLHSTGNTKFKGAGPGLGLPIAKGVIEAHAGRIWVESSGEDEQHLPGATFHIILPVNPIHTLEKVEALKAVDDEARAVTATEAALTAALTTPLDDDEAESPFPDIPPLPPPPKMPDSPLLKNKDKKEENNQPWLVGGSSSSSSTSTPSTTDGDNPPWLVGAPKKTEATDGDNPPWLVGGSKKPESADGDNPPWLVGGSSSSTPTTSDGDNPPWLVGGSKKPESADGDNPPWLVGGKKKEDKDKDKDSDDPEERPPWLVG